MARVTAMTPPPKNTYVRKGCGYVLPRKAYNIGLERAALFNGIHCPRHREITARYDIRKRKRHFLAWAQ